MTTNETKQPRTDAVVEGVRMHGTMVQYRERQVAALEVFSGEQERELYRLRAENARLREACQARIDEWHANSRNFTRAEPESLKLARAALDKAKD